MPAIFPDLDNNGNSGIPRNVNKNSKECDQKLASRDRFYIKLGGEIYILSLCIAIARVVELASSEDEATHILAHYILSDVALTQKIWRLANTVLYRTVSNTPVTTTSRAIFLLGFDTVKTSALALLLVDKYTKDPADNQFRVIVTIGEQHAVRQARFAFLFSPANDMFHLAMDNAADLMSADATIPKIRKLLPSSHRQLLPDTHSIMLLPLVNDQIPIGLFYADRRHPAPEGVSAYEAALIKILMGQMLTALNSRSGGFS
jgi:hypothetical protein